MIGGTVYCFERKIRRVTTNSFNAVVKKIYLLMCTTFAGGNPLKNVDDAIVYAPMFSE